MAYHKFLVRGPNINIDEEVSLDLARKVVSILYSDVSNLVSPVEERADSVALGLDNHFDVPKKNFKSFCEAYEVGRACEIVLACGAYLEEKGQKKFSSKDYRNFYKEYKGKKPSNGPSDITWAVDNGWISDLGGQVYKVTPAGNQVLKEKFPDSVKNSTRQTKKK